MNYDRLKKYIEQLGSEKKEKAYIWSIAIGLQAVDGLKTSEYLMRTAISHIEGEMTIEDAVECIDRYYATKPAFYGENRIEEADKVSVRMVEILEEPAFSLTPNEYIAIHRKLFWGIYKHAGQLRDYNITKQEWVLDGDTILYGSASELRATLEYDIVQEQNFSYKGLSMDEIIQHFALFLARLWQIHIFGEGNTRTTAIFFLKYIKTLGFEVTNRVFADHALYFRNALVRANYTNIKRGIHETTQYLELFLQNLLLEEKHKLYNEKLHITGKIQIKKPNMEKEKSEKPNIKPNIKSEKSKKKSEKPNIKERIQKDTTLRAKSKAHIDAVFDEFGINKVFTKQDVIKITGLKNTSAYELIQKMLKLELIATVSGQGKGKYQFK